MGEKTQQQQQQQSESNQVFTLKIDKEVTCRLLKKSPHTRTETDIHILSEQLRRIKLFEKYNNESEFEVIKECSKWLQLETFHAGQKVFEIGSFGEKFYIILDGKVGVNIKLTKQDQELKTVKELKTGESFGEIALIYKRPRLATIQCIDDCIFGVLSQKNYQNTLQSRELNKMLKEMSIFFNMALFNQWTQNKLRDLYLNSMWLNYKKGDLVYDLGDSADNMFIIQEGEFVVYTKSNFEKVVGEDQDEDVHAFNQFKRQLKPKDKNKNTQFLKVRILCQGEYFGEEEILNEKTRQYRIICTSFEGKALMIKKAHFLNHVFQDEISKQYILNRIKDKTHKIEERIQSMKNSLKDYKHFLYQDRALAKQQILLKSMSSQTQIKYDVFDSHEIIDKFMGQKQLKSTQQDNNLISLRGQSTSPLKGQKTLPVIQQSITSLTNIDQLEPSSPSKSQVSINKQNTGFYGDLSISPTSNRQKIKFQSSFSTKLIPKQSEIISNANKNNYEMYVIEQPDRLQLSPMKNKEKLMKQLNILNLNSPSPSNIEYSNQTTQGVQSMTEMYEQSYNRIKEIYPPTKQKNKVTSLVIQDEDIYQEEDDEDEEQNMNQLYTNNIHPFQQNSQLQSSRTNISIANHISLGDPKQIRQILSSDQPTTKQVNLTKIDESIDSHNMQNPQKNQRQNDLQKSGEAINQSTLNFTTGIGDNQDFNSDTTQLINREKESLLQQSYLMPLPQQQNKNFPNRILTISQSPKKKQIISASQNNIQSIQNNINPLLNNINSPQNSINPLCINIINSQTNNIHPIQKNSSMERIKVKLQLKAGLTSADSTPFDSSPIKLINRYNRIAPQSTPGIILKPHQSVCATFSSAADSSQAKNLLQQKQQSVLSRKSLVSQFKDKSNNLENGFNLFSVLHADDQNLLQRQIQQKTHYQQDLQKLKDHQKTYLRQWRQRSTTRTKQRKSLDQINYSLTNQKINKDNTNKDNSSNDCSRLDNQTLQNTQNLNDMQSTQYQSSPNKGCKNNSTFFESFNNGILSHNDEEFSPYLKKKIKNIVKNKRQSDSTLTNLGLEKRNSLINKQNLLLAQYPVELNNPNHSIPKEFNIEDKNNNSKGPSIERIQNQSALSNLIVNSIEKRNGYQINDPYLNQKTSFFNRVPTMNGNIPLNQDQQKTTQIIEQQQKSRLSLKASNSQFTTKQRKESVESNAQKLIPQQSASQQFYLSSTTNDSFTDSLAFQCMPQNKKKILLNIMNKSQVQSYFQKQMSMLNKANQQSHQTMQTLQNMNILQNIQPHQAMQSCQSMQSCSNMQQLSDDTAQNFNSKQRVSLDCNQKRRAVYSSVDSPTKKGESDNVQAVKRQQVKTLLFQLESQSPKKNQQSDRINGGGGGIYSQFPQFQNTFSYNFPTQKASDNFFSTTSIKLFQSHQPSHQQIKISSQPTTLQHIH